MERQESSHGEEKAHGGKSATTGLGLGLGVDVNLDLKLNELRNTLNMLTDTLRNVGETTTDIVANTVRKFRDVGVESIRQFKEQSGEQGELYNRIVQNLREAANKGEQEARSLLSDLGENVEAAGQKIQGAASTQPGEEMRH